MSFVNIFLHGFETNFNIAERRVAGQFVKHAVVGSVEIPCEISDKIMRGVVSIPHGYGHARNGVKLDIAKNHAGASINDLTDERVLDDLTGNAAFSNVKVRLETV